MGKILKTHPEKQAAYRSLDMAKKKEFRSAWAKETYSHCTATKSHNMTFREVDIRKGEYMTFGQLVQSYGGWKWRPSVEGAQRHAMRAAMMGGKWIMVDQEFSGLMHFLKMKVEFQYIVEEAWQRFAEFHNEGKSVELGAEMSSAASSMSNKDDTKDDQERNNQTNQKNLKAAAKSTSKQKNPDQPNQSPGKDKDKTLMEALSAATKVKNEFLRVTQKAEQLMKQIKSDPSYDDLNNEQNLKQLETMHASLQSSLSPFDNRFLLEDVKVLKESYVQEQFKKLLQEFVKVDPKPLKDFTAKCLRKHQA